MLNVGSESVLPIGVWRRDHASAAFPSRKAALPPGDWPDLRAASHLTSRPPTVRTILESGCSACAGTRQAVLDDESYGSSPCCGRPQSGAYPQRSAPSIPSSSSCPSPRRWWRPAPAAPLADHGQSAPGYPPASCPCQGSYISEHLPPLPTCRAASWCHGTTPENPQHATPAGPAPWTSHAASSSGDRPAAVPKACGCLKIRNQIQAINWQQGSSSFPPWEATSSYTRKRIKGENFIRISSTTKKPRTIFGPGLSRINYCPACYPFAALRSFSRSKNRSMNFVSKSPRRNSSSAKMR